MPAVAPGRRRDAWYRRAIEPNSIQQGEPDLLTTPASNTLPGQQGDQPVYIDPRRRRAQMAAALVAGSYAVEPDYFPGSFTPQTPLYPDYIDPRPRRAAFVARLAESTGNVSVTTLQGQDSVYGGPGQVPTYILEQPRVVARRRLGPEQLAVNAGGIAGNLAAAPVVDASPLPYRRSRRLMIDRLYDQTALPLFNQGLKPPVTYDWPLPPPRLRKMLVTLRGWEQIPPPVFVLVIDHLYTKSVRPRAGVRLLGLSGRVRPIAPRFGG